MKKITLLMLVFTLFAVTNVCAQKLKNGTYEGSAMARGYGDVYVNVSVSGREIKDISVRASNDQDIWMKSLINGNHPRYPNGMSPNERKDFEENSTFSLLKKEGPRCTSVQDFTDAIVKNQSTVIDVMSGATQTCEAVIEAVHSALREKNSDIVRAWEQEGTQKRLATAQRKEKLKEEERQRIAQEEAEERQRVAQAEAERKKLEEEEAERKRTAEAEKQQRIAEVLKQTPVTPAASEFKYDLAEGTYGGVKIIKYLGNAISIRIPEKIEGLAVTEIADGAFNRNTLVKIVIPSTIRVMPFYEFTELREVILGEGTPYIPWYEISFGNFAGAFENCTNLSKITIPNSVTKIGQMAFRGCINLKQIELPKKLKRIEDHTFQSSGLTSVIIPDSVKSIETDAFRSCKSLTQVTLPKLSGYEIAYHAFEDCSSLSEIIIPAELKRAEIDIYICDSAFKGCSSLPLATKSRLRELGYRDEF